VYLLHYHSSSVCLWLHSLCGPWPLSQFLNLYSVGRTPWTGDQPVARPLPTHRTTQTQNKNTQTSMRVGFEPTIPVFARGKSVHALDRAWMSVLCAFIYSVSVVLRVGSGLATG
jgi:hypothetical protein